MENREALTIFRTIQKCRHQALHTNDCGNCEKCQYRLEREQIDDAVAMAISALEKQEQERWHSVAERLPEEDGEYLVTFESGYADDYGFDPIGIAPFEVDCEGFGIWQESFHPVSLGSLGTEWVDIQVAAWRPLPEPYTEEEA